MIQRDALPTMPNDIRSTAGFDPLEREAKMTSSPELVNSPLQTDRYHGKISGAIIAVVIEDTFVKF